MVPEPRAQLAPDFHPATQRTKYLLSLTEQLSSYGGRHLRGLALERSQLFVLEHVCILGAKHEAVLPGCLELGRAGLAPALGRARLAPALRHTFHACLQYRLVQPQRLT